MPNGFQAAPSSPSDPQMPLSPGYVQVTENSSFVSFARRTSLARAPAGPVPRRIYLNDLGSASLVPGPKAGQRPGGKRRARPCAAPLVLSAGREERPGPREPAAHPPTQERAWAGPDAVCTVRRDGRQRTQPRLSKVTHVPFRLKKNFEKFKEIILWIMKKRESKPATLRRLARGPLSHGRDLVSQRVALSLKWRQLWERGWGGVGGVDTVASKDGRRRSLRTPGSSPWVHQRTPPLNDLLRHCADRNGGTAKLS